MASKLAKKVFLDTVSVFYWWFKKEDIVQQKKKKNVKFLNTSHWDIDRYNTPENLIKIMNNYDSQERSALRGSSICKFNFSHFPKWILKILTKVKCSVKMKCPLLFSAIEHLKFKQFILYTVSQELTQPTPWIPNVFMPGIFLCQRYTLEYAVICFPSFNSFEGSDYLYLLNLSNRVHQCTMVFWRYTQPWTVLAISFDVPSRSQPNLYQI